MSTIIEKAINKNRKAMTALFEQNKKKVFYVSYLLLGNVADATQMANYAFKNVWGNISAHNISTEEEFTHLLIRKGVEFAKKKIVKKDNKALRIPAKRNFLITCDKPIEDNIPVTEGIIKYLPDIHRFIFVLGNIADYLPEQIASTFKLDMKTVGMALEVEKSNIERILRLTNTEDYTYTSLVERIKSGEESVDIPEDVSENALTVIDDIARPIEKKRKITVLISVISGILVLGLIVWMVFAFVSGNNNKNKEEETSSYTETEETAEDGVIYEPVIDLDENSVYYADIEVADYGTITVELDQDAAPVTVSNFVNLANNGFYNGLTFHRIIEDFMMQGGDPNGNGTGGNTDEEGNEVNIIGEFSDNGYENNLSHTRGTISMARTSNDNNSASSQFFIVHKDSTDSLDGQYAAFGCVSEGMDIVDAICETAEPTDSNGTISAESQPVITSITIRQETAEEEN